MISSEPLSRMVLIAIAARPLGSVSTVKLLVPAAKRPGPLGGTTKSTEAFSTGLPNASVTSAMAWTASPALTSRTGTLSETLRAASRVVTTVNEADTLVVPAISTAAVPTRVEKRYAVAVQRCAPGWLNTVSVSGACAQPLSSRTSRSCAPTAVNVTGEPLADAVASMRITDGRSGVPAWSPR